MKYVLPYESNAEKLFYLSLGNEEEVTEFYGKDCEIEGDKLILKHDEGSDGFRAGESLKLFLPGWYGLVSKHYAGNCSKQVYKCNELWSGFYIRGLAQSYSDGTDVGALDGAATSLLKNVTYRNFGKQISAEITLNPQSASHILLRLSHNILDDKALDDSNKPPELPANIRALLSQEVKEETATTTCSMGFSLEGTKYYRHRVGGINALFFHAVNRYILLPYAFDTGEEAIVAYRNSLFEQSLARKILFVDEIPKEGLCVFGSSYPHLRWDITP